MLPFVIVGSIIGSMISPEIRNLLKATGIGYFIVVIADKISGRPKDDSDTPQS